MLNSNHSILCSDHAPLPRPGEVEKAFYSYRIQGAANF